MSEGGGRENVIVISIPTQHLGVLTNSRLNVCAFQIELEFGNDTLGTILTTILTHMGGGVDRKMFKWTA